MILNTTAGTMQRKIPVVYAVPVSQVLKNPGKIADRVRYSSTESADIINALFRPSKNPNLPRISCRHRLSCMNESDVKHTVEQTSGVLPIAEATTDVSIASAPQTRPQPIEQSVVYTGLC